MRRGIVAACALLVLLGVMAVARGLRAGGDEWTVVERRDLVFEVPITGALEAVDSAILGPPPVPNVWRFKISFLAPEGTEVDEGERVVAFDASDLTQELEEVRTERDGARQELAKRRAELEIQAEREAERLAEAEARLRRASLKVDRPAELVAGLDVALARLDHELARLEVDYLRARLRDLEAASEAELQALEQEAARAEDRIAELESAIARMTLTAPRAGTVVYATQWDGQRFAVGDTVHRMHHVVEIPDLRRMRAEGEVEEPDPGRLRSDQRVRLRLDAHPDVEFSGAIDSVGRTVATRPRRNPAKVASLGLRLDETDPQRMRPGMRFRGRVETGRAEGVLALPLAAVAPGPDGPVVWRRSAGRARPVAVELGRRTADWVEVLAGLEAGDRILADAAAAGRGTGR